MEQFLLNAMDTFRSVHGFIKYTDVVVHIKSANSETIKWDLHPINKRNIVWCPDSLPVTPLCSRFIVGVCWRKVLRSRLMVRSSSEFGMNGAHWAHPVTYLLPPTSFSSSRPGQSSVKATCCVWAVVKWVAAPLCSSPVCQQQQFVHHGGTHPNLCVLSGHEAI